MTKPITIVAFGDSTTAPREGVTTYAELMQQHWDARQGSVRVINAGVRGDHTDLALARYHTDVLAHNPDVVIMRFAINDSAIDLWKDPPATEPRVSKQRYASNMTQMAVEFGARGAQVVFCTPNPLAWAEPTLQLYGRSPYQPDDADGFNVLLKDYVLLTKAVADELEVPLVDLDAAFRNHASDVRPPWQELLLDGMHPNNAGHRLVADLLIPVIEKMLETIVQK
jgi:lysophospholipase L1-like esterase